jgi:hypothetical protein
VSETYISTTAAEIRLAREVALKSIGAAADTAVQVYLVESTSTRRGGEREYVRAQNMQEARLLAESFLGYVSAYPFVEKVWAVWEPDFTLTVAVADDDLEQELHLRALFVELVSRTSDISRGDLEVVPTADEPEDAELLFSR